MTTPIIQTKVLDTFHIITVIGLKKWYTFIFLGDEDVFSESSISLPDALETHYHFIKMVNTPYIWMRLVAIRMFLTIQEMFEEFRSIYRA